MTTDPRQWLASGTMTAAQWRAIAVSIFLVAIDGYDVLSISFAAPGIATDWHVSRAVLGVVMSMELLGMALGSIIIGALADRFGRRPIVISCLVGITAGMAMAGTVSSVAELTVWRLVTGLGIGGVVAAANAIASEFSNGSRRDLCVALMAVGYPVGAVLGGSIAVRLLAGHPWNTVFWLGAAMTFAAVPLVLAFIPESVAWLSGRQNPRYLGRLNHSLLRLGYPTLQAMPAAVIPHDLGSVGAVFRKPLLGRTGLLSLAYLFHSLTFYFFLKWLPKLLVDMGFAPSTAGGVLVWANVGGIVGGLLLGFLALKHGARAVTIVLLVASTVAIALFGRTAHDLTQLTAICMLCDFCANGALVGIFAVIARSYPSELRASGTGIASGVGRGGAFAAPIIAGALLQSGMGLPSVALLIGLSSLLAAGCLLALPPYAIEGGSRS